MSFLDLDGSSFWMAACMAAARLTSAKPVVNVVIHAGGKPFPSNKALLSTYSGYFKSVLNETSTTINLPTIPHEYFSILLAGMQTGGNFESLLNVTNVYQVLLYAQLLQIPTAISNCRNFISKLYLASMNLIQEPQLTPAATQLYQPQPKVIKPIPNKPIQDAWFTKANWIYSQYQSYSYPNAATSTTSNSHDDNDTKSRKKTTAPPSIEKDEEAAMSTGNNNPVKSKKKRKRENEEDCSGSWFLPRSRKDSLFKGILGDGMNGLLDIAACDGPVKFHKVKNYMAKESHEEEPVSEDYNCDHCSETFKSSYSLQKHQKKHDREGTKEGIESMIIRQRSCTKDCSASCGKRGQNLYKFTHESKSKPLVLRDINIQFFPCKICGAKFPSYYFVHKHKKMWHAEELLAEQQEQMREQKE